LRGCPQIPLKYLITGSKKLRKVETPRKVNL